MPSPLGGPLKTLIRGSDPLSQNDKESITADWTNGNLVYAIWDRLVFPQPRAGGVSFLTAAAFRGPAWFALRPCRLRSSD